MGEVALPLGRLLQRVWCNLVPVHNLPATVPARQGRSTGRQARHGNQKRAAVQWRQKSGCNTMEAANNGARWRQQQRYVRQSATVGRGSILVVSNISAIGGRQSCQQTCEQGRLTGKCPGSLDSQACASTRWVVAATDDGGSPQHGGAWTAGHCATREPGGAACPAGQLPAPVTATATRSRPSGMPTTPSRTVYTLMPRR